MHVLVPPKVISSRVFYKNFIGQDLFSKFFAAKFIEHISHGVLLACFVLIFSSHFIITRVKFDDSLMLGDSAELNVS